MFHLIYKVMKYNVSVSKNTSDGRVIDFKTMSLSAALHEVYGYSYSCLSDVLLSHYHLIDDFLNDKILMSHCNGEFSVLTFFIFSIDEISGRKVYHSVGRQYLKFSESSISLISEFKVLNYDSDMNLRTIEKHNNFEILKEF